jgi:hypothetical protein
MQYLFYAGAVLLLMFTLAGLIFMGGRQDAQRPGPRAALPSPRP